MTVLAVLAAAPGAGAQWIQIPPKRSCRDLPDGYVCSTKTQVTFGYPAGWRARAYDDGGMLVRSLIWITTEPFRAPCTTEGATTTCRPPVGTLRPNGVAAAWYVGGTRDLAELPGEFRTIGGHRAKVQVLHAPCPGLGGDEQIQAWIETRREHILYSLRACLRGPELAPLETAIADVMSSARFPYG